MNYIHVALQVVRNIVVTTFDVTFLCDILVIHNGQYSSFVTTEMKLNTADVTDITGSPNVTNFIKWTVPNDAGWKIHASL